MRYGCTERFRIYSDKNALQTFSITARPRDARSLGVHTLEIQGFELGPKI